MRRELIISIIAIVVLFTPGEAAAQSSEDFVALRFDGGFVQSDFRLGSNLFGSGVGSGSFGRVQSALQGVDGAVVFGNPASLAHVELGQIGVETRFPVRNGSLGIGSSSLLTDSSIRSQTDELLQDLSFPDNVTPVYTNTGRLSIGQPRQLSAFWLTWPVNENVGIGFGYRQPLILSSQTAISGASTLLRGKHSEEGSAVQIDFLAELALNSDLNLQVDELSLGTGGLLERYYLGDVWWGISFYRYSATADWNLDVTPQGVLTISGAEQFFFNDPEDPNLNSDLGDSNQFFWKVRAGYSGSGVGARIGLIHRTYGDRFGSSILLNIPSRIRMRDADALAESYLPVFVNLQGVIDNETEENTDLLDIEALELARPNLTRQTHDAVGTQMDVNLPVSLTLGVDLPLGRHTVVFNLIRYWGSLSVEGEYGSGSGETATYKIGKTPTWGLRAGFDFARGHRRSGFRAWDLPIRLLTLDFDGLFFDLMGDWANYSNARYRVSGGMQWGDSVVQGLDNTVINDLDALLGGRIPTSIAVGRAYSVFDRVDVGVHVMGVPDLLMRFSIALNFD